MAQTIRITQNMKSVIKAFKSIHPDAEWIQDLSETEAIKCILIDWTRQNFTSKEADEILHSEQND